MEGRRVYTQAGCNSGGCCEWRGGGRTVTLGVISGGCCDWRGGEYNIRMGTTVVVVVHEGEEDIHSDLVQ